MFSSLKIWWATIQNRSTPYSYTEADAQLFIDQISIRLANPQLFYTKIWFNDFDITLREVVDDDRVGEFSTLLFNRMQWEPITLIRSLIAHNMFQKENFCFYSNGQNMEFYDYTEHDVWRLMFHAMKVGDYTCNLPGNDRLWENAWLHLDEWRNQEYIETQTAADIIGPLLLKEHKDAHATYALNSFVSDPENYSIAHELYLVINSDKFDCFNFKKNIDFARTFTRWHDASTRDGGILYSNHDVSLRISYLLQRLFPSEWSYLDTCVTLGIPLLNRSVVLDKYLKDPHTDVFELPQIEFQ